MSQDRGSATGPAASNSNAAQVGDNRHDLQISPFISTTDPDENALQWTRWLKHFCRKLRFFRVSNVQDKVDAFYIYGGAEIENLLDTLPNTASASDRNGPNSQRNATRSPQPALLWHRRIQSEPLCRSV